MSVKKAKPKVETDNLADFLSSNAAKESQNIEIDKGDEPNLIEAAEEEALVVEEAKTRKKAGRPNVQEPATVQVAGYVTKTTKQKLSEKRGMIAESKIIGRLVEKYVNGDVEL